MKRILFQKRENKNDFITDKRIINELVSLMEIMGLKDKRKVKMDLRTSRFVEIVLKRLQLKRWTN